MQIQEKDSSYTSKKIKEAINKNNLVKLSYEIKGEKPMQRVEK